MWKTNNEIHDEQPRSSGRRKKENKYRTNKINNNNNTNPRVISAVSPSQRACVWVTGLHFGEVSSRFRALTQLLSAEGGTGLFPCAPSGMSPTQRWFEETTETRFSLSHTARQRKPRHTSEPSSFYTHYPLFHSFYENVVFCLVYKRTEIYMRVSEGIWCRFKPIKTLHFCHKYLSPCSKHWNAETLHSIFHLYSLRLFQGVDQILK